MALIVAGLAFGLTCGGTDAPGPDGAPERRLSAGEVPRIAYSADGDLWVVEPGGRGRRRVTTTPEWIEFDPSLSPHGQAIAYRRQRRTEGPSTGASEVVVIDLASGRRRRISPAEGGESTAWSPDGRQIALSNRTGIGLVGPRGGRVTPLNVIGSMPDMVSRRHADRLLRRGPLRRDVSRSSAATGQANALPGHPPPPAAHSCFRPFKRASPSPRVACSLGTRSGPLRA